MIFTIGQRKIVAVVLAACIVVGAISLFFVFSKANSDNNAHKAAVVTNGIECSAYAMDVLRDGGSAADAAITALLCEGVTCPQSTGIGGGFVMTLFTKATGKVETLNAREMAPLLSFKDMFINTTVVTGVKSIAVPGEIKGYWALHQKYGKLEWKRLFKPVIELCRKGHVVSRYLGNILKKHIEVIRKSPTLADIYIDEKTNDAYKIGEFIRRPQLAETLELIANEGVSTLYENGTLAQTLVKEIQEDGGIINYDDFLTYNVTWDEPVSQKVVDDRTFYTYPLPGSGPLVIFILNVLKNMIDEGPTLKSYHRIAETFKYAYGKRTALGNTEKAKQLSDIITLPEFADEVRKLLDDKHTSNDFKHYFMNAMQPKDQGTAHINILAPNGDAISVTGSINSLFGSKIRSRKTGIILNDSMDDFSVPGRINGYGLPPSPENYIEPKKRPLSSMCPSILLDRNGNVELMIGAAGGSKITSSIAFVLLRYLYFKESTWTAVHAPRIHHQLLPMEIDYELGLSKTIITGLESLGHKMHLGPSDSGFSSLTAIGRDGNKLIPVYDPRRLGSTSIL